MKIGLIIMVAIFLVLGAFLVAMNAQRIDLAPTIRKHYETNREANLHEANLRSKAERRDAWPDIRRGHH